MGVDNLVAGVEGVNRFVVLGVGVESSFLEGGKGGFAGKEEVRL